MGDSHAHGNGPERIVMIERRSGARTGMMLVLIVAVALIAAIAFFLFTQAQREDRRSEAVIDAAQSIDDAATRAGRSIGEAADRVAPKD